MWKILQPPAYKPEMEADKVDAKYKRMRLQVFLGIFIGYAGFYIVRKNFSMAIPELALLGFDQSELSIVLAMNAVAYALSKFLMGSVSDRSNARVFLPLGLVLAALSMMFMIVPVTLLGPEHKRLAIFIMAVLNFLVGWFNGMGWPPCGRVMTHWFSIKERGTKMSIWNCAHNVGGLWSARWPSTAPSGSAHGSRQPHGTLFPIGTYLFRRSSAIFIAILAYVLIRDTPQSCSLPSVEKWRNDYPEKLQRQAGGSAHDPRNILQIRPDKQTAVVHRHRQRFRLHGTLRMSRLGPDLPPRRAGLRHQAGPAGPTSPTSSPPFPAR